MNVGHRIKNRRKELGLSVDKLAELINKNRATIYRYEKNEIENMPYDVIEPLAKVLDVTPAYLMGWENENIQETKAISLYEDIQDNLQDLQENNAPLVNSFLEEVLKEQSNKNTFIPKIFRKLSNMTIRRQERVLEYAHHQLTVQQEGENNIINFDDYLNNHSEIVDVHGIASAGIGETVLDDIRFKIDYKGYVPSHDIALQVNGDSMEPLFEDKEIIFIEKTNSINSGQIGVFIIDGEAFIKKVFIELDHIRLVSLNKKYNDLYFYKEQSIELVGRVIL